MYSFLKHFILHPKNSWHSVSFTELSELYTSFSLKSLAMGMVGIFIPLYLHELDYSLIEIASLYFLFKLFCLLGDVIATKLIAEHGPKHVIRYSYLFLIAQLAALMSLNQVHWPLPLLAVLMAAHLTLFFSAFHVDLATETNKEQRGRQVGSLWILLKISGAAGPLAGGLLAAIYGPQVLLMVAIGIILVAALPLFMSSETVKHQHSFHLLLRRDLWRDYVSYAAFGFEGISRLVFWPYFLAVVLLGGNSYAEAGLFVSLGFAASLITANLFGRFIDKRDGRLLLRIGVTGMAFASFMRALVSTQAGIVLVTVVGEIFDTAGHIPFVKGYYGRAEDMGEDGAAYVGMMEVAVHLGAGLFAFMLMVLLAFFTTTLALQIAFLVTAVVTTLMAVERFPALDRSR